MNLTKKEFKKLYSEYRKKLSDAVNYGGLEKFHEIMISDMTLREIRCKTEYPVSLKIWSYKHKKINLSRLKINGVMRYTKH